MPRSNRTMVLVMVMIATAMVLAACSRGPGPVTRIEPATVSLIEETGLGLVVFTAAAIERVGVQTGTVLDNQLSRSGTRQMTIPYSSVIYDANGKTWTYTSPEPATYLRHQITIDYIEGDLAFLLDGPPAGTEVVTVGAAEVYGAETGIGK